MTRPPPRSTLFPYNDALPICEAHLHRERVAAVGVRPGGGQVAPRLMQLAAKLQREPHADPVRPDRKSTRLNSSHSSISYAVFCLKKKSGLSCYSLAQRYYGWL